MYDVQYCILTYRALDNLHESFSDIVTFFHTCIMRFKSNIYKIKLCIALLDNSNTPFHTVMFENVRYVNKVDSLNDWSLLLFPFYSNDSLCLFTMLIVLLNIFLLNSYWLLRYRWTSDFPANWHVSYHYWLTASPDTTGLAS